VLTLTRLTSADTPAGNPAATSVAIRCTHLMNFGPTVLVSKVKPVFGKLNHPGNKMEIAAFLCLMVLLIALPTLFMVR
jgi:hypothetical protein